MSESVSFGGFVLNPGSRELSRGGNPVALSPKAYQLLELLVASSPKALSKSSLQDRLWPDTFVVEKNLANLIAEIRQALADDPSHPRFIRTVHRFGYAFREPVHPSGDGALTRGAARFRLLWENARVTLADGEHVLGRDPDLELFLDSPGISRRHAIIRINGDDVTLDDLGSKNGTYVGARRVNGPTTLVDRDVFTVGSVKLTIQAVRRPASTRTEAPAEIRPTARSSTDRGRRGRC